MKKFLLPLIFFVLITSFFFYKTILYGYIPFPGDLLVGEYAPYNSYPFFGYAAGGYPNKGQDFDVLRLLYPAKEFSINMLKKFEFPLWNPNNFSGNPHLASLQSGTFYPFNFIFFIFPFIFAWGLYIFIQPVLAGMFSYLLLREFGLRIKSSLFGGLVFAFSSYFVVWIEYGNIGHSIIWLPCVLWLSLKNLNRPKISTSIFIIISLTFAILAGYIQLVFYLYIFLFSFIFFNIFLINKKNKIKKFLLFFPIFIFPILLSAAQLLPTFELFYNSSRTSYTWSSIVKLLVPQFHLITLFVPDFFGNPATRNYWLTGTYIERVSYIGVIPLFFVIYGFFQKRTPWMWFFAISLIVVYFLVFDSFIARLFYILQIPFLSTGVPSRMMYLFCFAGSMLSAFGFDSFEKNNSIKILTKTISVMAVVYISLWIFVFVTPIIFTNVSWVTNLNIAKRNLFIPSFIFLVGVVMIVFANKLTFLKKHIITLFFILTIFDLFYFFHKITPFAPLEAVYPSTEVLAHLKKIQDINRSWGYGSGSINANIQTHEKIFSTDGYDALHIKRYGELISVSDKGKIAMPLSRSEANLAPGFGESDLRNNQYRQQVLNLLGVKYILHKTVFVEKDFAPDNQTFPQDIYALVWQKGNWQIYENKKALPRVFLAAEYVVETEKRKIIDRLLSKTFNPRDTLILEKPIMPELKLEKDDNSVVNINKYESNKVVFSTSAASNMLLFLSDNDFPGWKVSVDGMEKKIYRANYSFRAVPVEKGKHTVVFWYQPESFIMGVKISVFFGVSMILWILYSLVKNKKHAV